MTGGSRSVGRRAAAFGAAVSLVLLAGGCSPDGSPQPASSGTPAETGSEAAGDGTLLAVTTQPAEVFADGDAISMRFTMEILTESDEPLLGFEPRLVFQDGLDQFFAAGGQAATGTVDLYPAGSPEVLAGEAGMGVDFIVEQLVAEDEFFVAAGIDVEQMLALCENATLEMRWDGGSESQEVAFTVTDPDGLLADQA